MERLICYDIDGFPFAGDKRTVLPKLWRQIIISQMVPWRQQGNIKHIVYWGRRGKGEELLRRGVHNEIGRRNLDFMQQLFILTGLTE